MSRNQARYTTLKMLHRKIHGLLVKPIHGGCNAIHVLSGIGDLWAPLLSLWYAVKCCTSHKAKLGEAADLNRHQKTYHHHPHVNGPGRVSSFERGGHLQRGPCFFFRRGESIDTRTGGHWREFSSKLQKNYLGTHFLACAFGVNVVGTNAWYLLHL